MKQLIYLDNGATTPVSKNVYNAMLPYLLGEFGNPSSLHKAGRDARQAVNRAREQVATAIGALPEEIIFTGGGSEADNLALKGILASRKKYGTHVITSAIEHPAILETCAYLERCGYQVTYLPVDQFGLVSPEAVEAAITADTALVSIMAANNEIGTVQPIADIGAICKAKGVLFHTDAVQAICHMKIDVNEMNIDLLSLSGHKIHGPKGIGVLYCRKGIALEAVNHGGGQEKGKRSGTENVPCIVGLGEAMRHGAENMEAEMAHVAMLRDRFLEGALKIPFVHLTGHPTQRLPGTASITIDCIEGEGLILMLDMKGICASTGSACSTGSLDPSHVLIGIGLPHETAHGSLRISIGTQNTVEEIDYTLTCLNEVVTKLRAMSPLWEDKLKKINEENVNV